MLNTSELHEEYFNYHFVNFGAKAEEVPKLDARVINREHHAEIYLGEKSISHALLVHELLRKLAIQRHITLMLVVPCTKATEDYHAQGFVRSSFGWCAAC